MKSFRVRKFLNTPGYHSVGFILAQVNKDSIKCIIGDCNKVIDLDFHGFSKDGKVNAVQKAKLLAVTLTNFANALEEFYANGGESD